MAQIVYVFVHLIQSNGEQQKADEGQTLKQIQIRTVDLFELLQSIV